MTNTPGDGQTPQDPHSGQSGQNQPGQDPSGYWEQQSQQQGQQPHGQYGQQPPGQPPYGQAPGYPAQPPMQYAPDHPKATTVLVLGILGIVVCGIIAPFAWSMGKKTIAEIDASNGMVGGRGAANAGYILGIVGTVILGLSVLMVIFFFGILGLGALSSTGY